MLTNHDVSRRGYSYDGTAHINVLRSFVLHAAGHLPICDAE